MELVEARYGPHARDVVQNLFLLGHSKVSDLTDVYTSQQKQDINGQSNGHSASNGINGHVKSNRLSAGQLDRILIELLELGLVEPVVERIFRSPADAMEEITGEILRQDYNGEAKGKAKDALQAKASNRLQKLESDGLEWRSKVLKRPASGVLTNGVNGSSKRRKLSHNDDSVNGDSAFEDDGTRLDVGSSSFREPDDSVC